MFSSTLTLAAPKRCAPLNQPMKPMTCATSALTTTQNQADALICATSGCHHALALSNMYGKPPSANE